MITLWGRRSAFNVQKVLWFIEELGLDHTQIDAGGDYGGLEDPGFLAMNPHGRVPVLRDGEAVIWESQTILRYLAARYGSPKFWSDDPAKRAAVEQWMDWSQTSLQPAFLTGVFWGHYRTPRAQRDEAAIGRNLRQTNACLRLIDEHLADNSFLAGEDFTLADIPAGTHLFRYFGIDISRPKLPHVQDWYERLCNRAAYRKHVMLDFSDMYGRLDY